MKNINIIITLIISLFLLGCVKKDKGFGDLVDLEVSVTSISEAYFGETSNVVVSANAQCKVKLYVDDEEKLSSANGKITFDVSKLPVGNHTIKIVVEDAAGNYEKSFRCKVSPMRNNSRSLRLMCSRLTQATAGMPAYIAAQINVDGRITVSVDGVERQSSDTRTLAYDISGLSVGIHQIKVTAVSGDKKDAQEFEVEIIEKEKVYEIPRLYIDNVVNKTFLGEALEITASTDIDCKITIYIDGTAMRSANGKTLTYDMSGLQLGTHTVKFVAVNGDKEKAHSFELEVEEKEIEHVEYVDLGLPSGLLWATCNVGADNPWDCGDYFAWGETEPKDWYDWSTYKYGYEFDELTKYCYNSMSGYNGFSDNLTVLQSEDDAATVNMGKDWRMPTGDDWRELMANCEFEWTSNYLGSGVAGRIVWDTYSHTTHIFLPASGYRFRGILHHNENEEGRYASSELFLQDGFSTFPDQIRSFEFDSGSKGFSASASRTSGLSVRAVRLKTANSNTSEETYEVPTLSLSCVLKAIEGESEEITASTVVDSKITLYVDGVNKQTSTTKTLSYNVSELSVGTHQIKIVAVNGDKSDEYEFELEVVENKIIYEVPTLTIKKSNNQTYVGELNEITASTSVESTIVLYVDGAEKMSTTNRTLTYNTYELEVGKHKLKFIAINGDQTDEKDFEIEIQQKVIVYEVPRLTVTNVINKAIEGESAIITAETDISCLMTLYVDGYQKATSDTKTLSYNVSKLSVGTHQIKIVAVNGDKSDEREFTIEILAPTYIYDGNATIPDMGNEDL